MLRVVALFSTLPKRRPTTGATGFGYRRKLALAMVGQFAVSRSFAPPLSSEPLNGVSGHGSTS